MKDNNKDNNRSNSLIKNKENIISSGKDNGKAPERDTSKDELRQESDYSFIQEKIKDRPINRKKFVRKMILTAGLAIIFGLVACMTFICLEPLFGKVVNKEEPIQLEHVDLSEESNDITDDVTVIINDQPFDDDTSFEETDISNMPLTDDDMDTIIGTAAVSGNQVPVITEKEVKVEFELEDYRLLYKKMYALSVEFNKSMVLLSEKPSTTTSGEISLDGESTFGIILDDNSYELLILANSSQIDGIEVLDAKFCNGDVVEATLKKVDKETGLGIYAVKLEDIKSTTKVAYTYATLGSSISTVLNGTPVVAVGNPLNTRESVCYGAITSTDMISQKVDASYQILTTDIYADVNANGFLINVRGQVVGIITSEGHASGLSNLIYAYGISSVRNLAEDLANDEMACYVGIYSKDVTEEARKELGVPVGAYVTAVENGSPAMNVGIIPGDVIVGVGEISINNVNVYTQCLRTYEPGEEIKVTVMRYSNGEYKELTLDIVTGEH